MKRRYARLEAPPRPAPASCPGAPALERALARRPRIDYEAAMASRRVLRSVVRRTAAAAAVAAVATLLGGCDVDLFGSGASRATLTYTEDARAAYNEAMASFRAREWEDARALFSEVKKLFAYSRYARLAELRIADVDFEQEKFTDAIAGYREFVQNHRTDDDVEYAKYRLVKALFLDIDDTILLPPQEERDQATTLEAYREVKSFLREFPGSRYRIDARYMLEVITGRLVRHELYVARFYLIEDKFEAAVARCDYAVKNFPGSGLDPEALVLKGETLLKMKKVDEAREVFNTVINDYGGPFATTAKSFLDEMDSKAKAPPKAQPKGG
jgi:outer membrane protein assembly factor BamD